MVSFSFARGGLGTIPGTRGWLAGDRDRGHRHQRGWTMILMVVFFDQWWGFLCDVCGRPRTWRERGKEELVPDWQRSSWGFRVEDDNRPAYPSFGSPPTLQTIQEEVATHTQSRKVDAGRSLPDQNTSPNHLEFPPVLAPKDNGQVYSAGRMPYGPSRRYRKQFSPPSGLVNDATAYNYHSPLSRSNTQRSASSEDAYDGLAP
ncbi:hypothetical protein BC826DRAFT_11649 [Russula brevipes]|nr:hypothetical protein BC826DRAFT_11649 [Russula brevipes]